jgi:predicted Fe-S protein YdhL (DUF1289 family)
LKWCRWVEHHFQTGLKQYPLEIKKKGLRHTIAASLNDTAKLMEQLEFFSIPSPCIGVCAANSKGYCKGCLRSREERLYWLKMNDVQKQQVLRLVGLRRQKIQRLAWEQGQARVELPEQMGFEF